MAFFAIPIIEAVATRAVVALGLSAASGAALEVAQKRRKEADEARTSPIARTDALRKTKKKCEDCTADRGTLYVRKTKGWSADSIGYQIRIGQMPPAPEGCLHEWNFNGVKFDGFESKQCLLKEAKARYDKFFDDWGAFNYKFQEEIFTDMTGEAISQNTAASPKPPIQLKWYFLEPVSYRYMSKVLAEATPQIEVLFQP